ncbi:MAG: ABC transporter permease [Bacillota bacterium]
MAKYLLNRIVTALISFWIVVTLTFIMMHAIPGGPFAREKALPDVILKNLNERYHLNDPLTKQYFDYLKNIVKLDFGPSFNARGRSVNDIIREGLPVSATLGLFSILIAIGIGVPAGIVSALRQNKWQDGALMFLAIIGVSVPNFVLATLLQFFLGFKLHWLPPALWGTPQQMIMPAIALSAFTMAFIARLIRSSMLETLAQDYVRTARAKGLSGTAVILKHTLKNALIPAVAVSGPLAAGLIAGSFVIERIFVIPGLGRYFVNSIYNRDYTTIMGVTIVDTALILSLSLIVDLVYAFIDPRIKLTGKGD